MMKNNFFFFRSSTNDANKTPSPPLNSKEVSSWRSVSLSSGSFYDNGSGKKNFTDLSKSLHGHSKKVHPKKSGRDSSRDLSVPVLIRTIRRLTKEKKRMSYNQYRKRSWIEDIEQDRLHKRAREIAEQNVSLQREVSSFNEKEVDNRIKISFSEKQLEDLSKRIKQVSEENQNLRQQLTQLQEEYRVAQDNRDYVRENYQEKVKELKSEILLTTVLREKLYSDEMDIKQLQADLDVAVRSNDILKCEVQIALDALSCATPKLKYLELQNEARKANQTAMVAEKKKTEAPAESRGTSKQKWMEERKKKIGKLLDADGLDMSKAYMLDTQESAEAKYKKWDKEPAPAGWDENTKRTKNVGVDVDEYNKMKEADPEFYREASSLQYGKAPKLSDDKIERMVKELKDRDEKRQSFSRRRKFQEEKDIDSIHDGNEHFNKKIEHSLVMGMFRSLMLLLSSIVISAYVHYYISQPDANP
ncbi:hypothetical protein T459_26555 [Capsicum annuum]|uniref:Uncharacterized protein n=1 Tax=Capsicum annuum TaxID=4072 RepID=A0A2G2YPB4_CAPAN|nr:hypothetical protein T459_26555 [Capsicum annuum]